MVFGISGCSMGCSLSWEHTPSDGQPGRALEGPAHLGVVGDGALGHRALFLHQEAEPSPLFRQSRLVPIRHVILQLPLLVADGFDVLEQGEEQGGGCRRGPRHGTHTCACTAPSPPLLIAAPRRADSAVGCTGRAVPAGPRSPRRANRGSGIAPALPDPARGPCRTQGR